MPHEMSPTRWTEYHAQMPPMISDHLLLHILQFFKEKLPPEHNDEIVDKVTDSGGKTVPNKLKNWELTYCCDVLTNELSVDTTFTEKERRAIYEIIDSIYPLRNLGEHGKKSGAAVGVQDLFNAIQSARKFVHCFPSTFKLLELYHLCFNSHECSLEDLWLNILNGTA
jgi:hypothetical protein